MVTSPWVRLPSAWIQDGRLVELRWEHGGRGSDNIAALMTLTVIAHEADQRTGVARLTYDALCALTGLSRAKISNGLDVLRRMNVVERGPEGARSTYHLVGYTPDRNWAKLPARSMYHADSVAAYAHFQLRTAVELEALKLFFLFVAQRDRETNLASIGYDKIASYTGVRRERIKAAISFLASFPLIYVEHVPIGTSAHGVSNAYRIVGVDAYRHMGTRGRAMNAADLPTD